MPTPATRPPVRPPVHPSTRPFRTTRLMLPIVAATLFIPAVGCANLDPQAIHADAQAVRAALDEQLLEREAALPTLPEPDRSAAERVIAATRASRDALDAAIATATQTASDPGSAVTSGASALAPFLPPGAQIPLILGATAVAGLLRARQLKGALRSVAKGLDVAMKNDPDFARKFREHAPVFRSYQTATAHRVVDETTKPGTMLRLPL